MPFSFGFINVALVINEVCIESQEDMGAPRPPTPLTARAQIFGACHYVQCFFLTKSLLRKNLKNTSRGECLGDAFIVI